MGIIYILIDKLELKSNIILLNLIIHLIYLPLKLIRITKAF